MLLRRTNVVVVVKNGGVDLGVDPSLELLLERLFQLPFELFFDFRALFGGQLSRGLVPGTLVRRRIRLLRVTLLR